jgi:DNA polymerase delta subunit 2
MLEDESGRIQLVGESVQKAQLVTGVIAGALGIETSSGEFEVVDICYAGMTTSNDESVTTKAVEKIRKSQINPNAADMD